MELCGATLFLLLILSASLFSYLGCIRRSPSVCFRLGKAETQPSRIETRGRLCGYSLRVMAHLFHTAFGKYYLIPKLIRSSNLATLHALVIPDEPTFVPVVSPEKGECDTPKKPPQHVIRELQDSRTCPPREGFKFRGIEDFTNAYRSGSVTPTRVALNIMQAMEASDCAPLPLRAIVQWDRTQILRMAEASTSRYKESRPLSPLDGVPVCLKEEIKVVPYHQRAGTTFLGTDPVTEDATVTRKLREAGALIIGVSNMHELGVGYTGCNPNRLHGTARNPYNPHHYPGGSSSGSAVAVASGLCPLALGTDSGGSVRVPASFCGLVGLKGTFGRISAHGSIPITHSVLSVGPICASVLDTALAYTMLAGPDPLYPYGLEQPPLMLDGMSSPGLHGLKLAVDWTFFKMCDADVLETCQNAVEYLKSMGATIVDISIPELDRISTAFFISYMAESWEFMQQDYNEHFKEMNLDSQYLLAISSQVHSVDFIRMNRQRSRTMKCLKKIFCKVNCILTPGTDSMEHLIPTALLLTDVSARDNNWETHIPNRVKKDGKV
ncbi:hypothetical protein FKM82_008021 [Ascaphus truei]